MVKAVCPTAQHRLLLFGGLSFLVGLLVFLTTYSFAVLSTAFFRIIRHCD